MKSFIVFTLAVLPFVHCAVDPTTICMPEKFSADVYDARRALNGVVTVDYNKKLAASLYGDGVRHVIDMHTDMLYNVKPDSTCTRTPYPLQFKKQLSRCLPANAVNPGANIALGLPNDRVILQYWDINYGDGLTVYFAFTTGSPAIPVLRQALINGTDDGMVVYVNPILEANSTLMAVPLVCPDEVVV